MRISVGIICLLLALVSYAQAGGSRLIQKYGVSFGKFDKEFTTCNNLPDARGYTFRKGQGAELICTSSSLLTRVYALNPEGQKTIHSGVRVVRSALLDARKDGFFGSDADRLTCDLGVFFIHVSPAEDPNMHEEVAGWPFVQRCKFGADDFFAALFLNQDDLFLVLKKAEQKNSKALESNFEVLLRSLRRTKRD